MNVLIVDDEKDIAFLLGLEIKLQGHHAASFEFVKDAQDYLSDPSHSVDVIICDFQMPKMNGLEFFHWVRANNIACPFYILTGEPTMDVQKLLKEGISQVLFKPHDLNKISTILKE